MDATQMLELVTSRFPAAVTSSHAFRGDATVVLAREALLELAQFVRDDDALRLNMLMDLSAVDYSTFGQGPKPAFFASSGVEVRASTAADDEAWPGPPSARFVVVYHFYSIQLKHRLRFVVPVQDDAPAVDSLVALWPGADWLEREVWDMFGIDFRGHPNLKRILMYDGFEGHPLRKDYPVNKRQPLIGPLN
jgi:NADH-quinone oxidoreductase subunit C